MIDDLLVAGLPKEILEQPNFEEALRLALQILSGDIKPLTINTWAEAEVTKAS